MCNLVSVKKWYPKIIYKSHKNMFLSIIITNIIYSHETLNVYSMINLYTRYLCIRVATEKNYCSFFNNC